jgi:aminoglycoside phosphotransferase (APT) family kinase protein
MTVLGGLHADRPVHLETRCGDNVVVKRYVAGGAEAIYGQMCALWSSPFGAERRPPGLPRPIRVNADREEVEMQFLPGDAIGSRGDLGLSVQQLPEVARLLADLHRSGVLVDRRRSPSGLLRSSRRKVDELTRTGREGTRGAGVAELARQLVELLALAVPVTTELVLSHGDFSPRNVLLTPKGLALIDFDRLQMAAPERDISYWGAWTWVTMLTSGRQPSWRVADDLSLAYNSFRGTAAGADPSSSAFYRAVALLRIAHGWSALQAAPQISTLVLREALRLLVSAS